MQIVGDKLGNHSGKIRERAIMTILMIVEQNQTYPKII